MIGILDYKGDNKNPLTDQPYSDGYKKLAKLWSNFPAYKNREQIINDIKNNQITLIISGTGSGKTVLMPKYALHTLGYKGKIAITLPKQIIAKSAAEFAAATLDVNVGEHVGYKYKGSPRNSFSKSTNLLYATDGTIVAKLLRDSKLSEFDMVIIDEAHERKVQIDLLFYLLRETIRQRPTFKLIIMSATIDPELFENYFEDYKIKTINIGGKTNYPISSVFLDKDVSYDSALNVGYDTAIKIMNEDKLKEDGSESHDIIFFITSANEAFKVCNKVNLNENAKEMFCIEVYSGMKQDQQNLAQDKILYKKDGKYNRKLVLATNVAESSLTIDGIKYVIEGGYELKSTFDPVLMANRLDRKRISRAQVKQRMGRSGRTSPGVCHHLYTEDSYNDFIKFPEPEIRLSDISAESLKILNIDGIKTTKNLLNIFSNFIEPPREQYIRTAINVLTRLGAIENNKITPLGTVMTTIGGDEPTFSMALVLSKLYNCSREVVMLTSLISASRGNMGNIFKQPKSPSRKLQQKLDQKFNKVKKKFRHRYGDHLSILKVFAKFNEVYEKERQNKSGFRKTHKWCYDNYVNFKTLHKARRNASKMIPQIRRQFISSESIGIPIIESVINSHVDNRIMVCLLGGFQINTAVRGKGKYYRTQFAKNLQIKVDDKSFLKYDKQLAQNVFYNELFIFMDKPSLNIVSKITTEIKNLLM